MRLRLLLMTRELSGIIALTSTYKAMALGYLIQTFEQVPITAGNNAEFSSREQVLTRGAYASG
ncbi:MAG: hypothetical protein U5J63_06150 [Fodinibius sp.]|nr:hypothetical protein [Fodinibius sp.]